MWGAIFTERTEDVRAYNGIAFTRDFFGFTVDEMASV